MKKISIIGALALISAFALYRYLNPNIIHGYVVCGHVLQNGRPVANQKFGLFSLVGGHRFEMEKDSLKDSGTIEDRTQALYSVQTDGSGKFCSERIPLKYFYKVDRFEAQRLALGTYNPPVILDPYKPRPPDSAPADAVDGKVLSQSMEQRSQTYTFNAIFELKR